MLWIKAFHIISMVIWFSGLFYLPRIFVYHALTQDAAMKSRFLTMEKKLYYFVMNPGVLLTFIFGLALFHFNMTGYSQALWFQIKIALVGLLLIYHVYLGFLLRAFQRNQNQHSSVFYRWVNEVPTIFLVLIVCLAVLRPSP